MKAVPILEVAEVATKRPSKFEGSRVYYATAGVGGTSLLEGTPVTYDERPSRANLVAKRGDVMFAKMQETDKVVYVNGGAESAIFSTGFFNLRANEKYLDSRYLFWFLRSAFFRREKDRRCTGATQKALTFSGLKEIEIPLTDSVVEQQRIAAILDKADCIRRKRQMILKKNSDFVRAAYLHTIGRLNSYHGDWEPFAVAALAEDRKGAIRSGPFGSALRHSEFVDEGIAVLGIDNAVQNKFAWAERRFITPSKYEELRRYKVFPGDVIITIMGTTGRSAVVPDDIPEAITTKHLATITCNKELIHPEVLSFAIHSDPLIISQIKSFNKGAIMDGLNLGIIRELEINLPPMEEQLRFVRMLRKARAIEESSQTPDGSGEDLFQSLSQRAFRGEL